MGTLKPQIIQQYGDWYTGCYIWYSEEGPERAAALPSPLLVAPNVTAHSSTASVPISYNSKWHCNCLCASKGYKQCRDSISHPVTHCRMLPSGECNRMITQAGWRSTQLNYAVSHSHCVTHLKVS